MKTQNLITHRAHSLAKKPLFKTRMLLCGLTILTMAGTTRAGAQTAPSIEAPQIQTPVIAPDLTKFLAWDADAKTIDVKAGELKAHFTFYVTNISSDSVLITNLVRSCGCTEATMPEQPWTLSAGASGPIKATMDLNGKAGRIIKQLTVQSALGAKVLKLEVNIPPIPATAQPANHPPVNSVTPAASVTEPRMDRIRNQQLVAQDRQAVFKGDCAKCHVEPTVGKTGKELYQAGCGICHDAEHRAEMVPSLLALKHPTDAAYWREWITTSKPGSMMPAFGKSAGGPLDEAQIDSLVTYLTRTISKGS